MPKRSYLFLILSSVASVACLLSSGCSPARPTNVPSDAIYVSGGKTVWWERCSYDKGQDTDKCQTFNAGGAILEDEVYLPYDGGRPALPPELVIDPDGRVAGPYIICLKNGRILLPQSHFAHDKKLVDDVLKSQ
jgi:hypothetical protein